MSGLLDRIHAEIRDRLRESEAAVREYERLEPEIMRAMREGRIRD